MQLGHELEAQVAEWKDVESSHEKHVTELNVKIEHYEQLLVQLRNDIHINEQKYNITINQSSAHLQQEIQVHADYIQMPNYVTNNSNVLNTAN